MRFQFLFKLREYPRTYVRMVITHLIMEKNAAKAVLAYLILVILVERGFGVP